MALNNALEGAQKRVEQRPLNNFTVEEYQKRQGLSFSSYDDTYDDAPWEDWDHFHSLH
jgi:hypothetical protein